MQILKSLDLKQSIIIELELNKVGTKIKADNFLDKVVSQIQGFDDLGIDSVLLDGSYSVTDEIDFLKIN